MARGCSSDSVEVARLPTGFNRRRTVGRKQSTAVRSFVSIAGGQVGRRDGDLPTYVDLACSGAGGGEEGDRTITFGKRPPTKLPFGSQVGGLLSQEPQSGPRAFSPPFSFAMAPPASTARRRPHMSSFKTILPLVSLLWLLLTFGSTSVVALSVPDRVLGERGIRDSGANVFEDLVARRSAQSRRERDGLEGRSSLSVGEAGKVSVKRSFSDHIHLKQVDRRRRRRLQTSISTSDPSLSKRAASLIVDRTAFFNSFRSGGATPSSSSSFLGKRTQNISGEDIPDSRIGGSGDEETATDELYKIVPEVRLKPHQVTFEEKSQECLF